MNRTSFETKQTSTWLKCQYEMDADMGQPLEDDADIVQTLDDDTDTVSFATGRVSEDGWTIP